MPAAQIARTAGDGLSSGIQPATTLNGTDTINLWRGDALVSLPLSSLGTNVGLLRQTLALTKTQVATLWTTPVLLLPAPGAGKMNFIIGGVAQYKHGTAVMAGANWLVLTAKSTQPSSHADQLGMFEPMDMDSHDEIGPLQMVGKGNSAQSYIGGPVYVASPDFDLGLFGPVASMTVVNGGGGYAVNDTGFLDYYSDDNSRQSGNPSSQDATYRVTAVSGGVVTGITLTNPGTAYSTDQFACTAGGAQHGAGNGNLTVAATVTDCETGPMLIEVIYTIVDAGA